MSWTKFWAAEPSENLIWNLLKPCSRARKASKWIESSASDSHSTMSQDLGLTFTKAYLTPTIFPRRTAFTKVVLEESLWKVWAGKFEGVKASRSRCSFEVRHEVLERGGVNHSNFCRKKIFTHKSHEFIILGVILILRATVILKPPLNGNPQRFSSFLSSLSASEALLYFTNQSRLRKVRPLKIWTIGLRRWKLWRRRRSRLWLWLWNTSWIARIRSCTRIFENLEGRTTSTCIAFEDWHLDWVVCRERMKCCKGGERENRIIISAASLLYIDLDTNFNASTWNHGKHKL